MGGKQRKSVSFSTPLVIVYVFEMAQCKLTKLYHTVQTLNLLAHSQARPYNTMQAHHCLPIHHGTTQRKPSTYLPIHRPTVTCPYIPHTASPTLAHTIVLRLLLKLIFAPPAASYAHVPISSLAAAMKLRAHSLPCPVPQHLAKDHKHSTRSKPHPQLTHTLVSNHPQCQYCRFLRV
jgi:hypothetical protein